MNYTFIRAGLFQEVLEWNFIDYTFILAGLFWEVLE